MRDGEALVPSRKNKKRHGRKLRQKGAKSKTKITSDLHNGDNDQEKGDREGTLVAKEPERPIGSDGDASTDIYDDEEDTERARLTTHQVSFYRVGG